MYISSFSFILHLQGSRWDGLSFSLSCYILSFSALRKRTKTHKTHSHSLLELETLKSDTLFFLPHSSLSCQVVEMKRDPLNTPSCHPITCQVTIYRKQTYYYHFSASSLPPWTVKTGHHLFSSSRCETKAGRESRQHSRQTKRPCLSSPLITIAVWGVRRGRAGPVTNDVPLFYGCNILTWTASSPELD